MPDALIDQLDGFAAEHEYDGRSDAVREALELLIEDRSCEDLGADTPRSGPLTVW